MSNTRTCGEATIDLLRKYGVSTVFGINPDFVALARACHCHGVSADSRESFVSAFNGAPEADRPTIIVVREGDDWLS